jgi:phage tail-like protein
VAVRAAADVAPIGSTGGRLDDAGRDALDATAQRLPPLRRDLRVGKPVRSPQWLVNQLPVGMLQSDFFVRFASIFQEVAGSLLDGADQIEHVPDATVTPVPLVGLLGSWIGVDTIDASLPDELQRLILRSSSKALAHRGTIKGLLGYLEMLSGDAAEVVDGGGIWIEGDAPEDFAWVRMSVQGTGHLSEDEFVALVRDEVPAHVRAELWVAGRRVLSTRTDEPAKGRV